MIMTNRRRAEGNRRRIRLANMGRAALRRGVAPTRAQGIAMAARGLPIVDVRTSRMAPSDLAGLPMAA